MEFMYDKSLVIDILDQIIDAEIIFGICQNHIDNLLDTLKTIKMDLAK